MFVYGTTCDQPSFMQVLMPMMLSVDCSQLNCGLLGAAGKGPTLLLVKDKQGQLFGGYASEPWLKNGKYYGESHYLPTTCCCHLCLFNLFVAAITSVPLKEQWPGLGKAAETVSSLDHLQ